MHHRTLLPICFCLLSAACGDPEGEPVPRPDAGLTEPDAGPPVARTDAGRPPSGVDAGPPAAETCPGADTADYIYVLGREGVMTALWRFAPRTNAFERIGAIDCGGPSIAGSFDSVSALAIARDGAAWVLRRASDGARLHPLDLRDATCDPAGEPLPDDPIQFLAFASDAPGGSTETLYASSHDGDWFGTVSMDGLTTEIGSLPLSGSRVMITGTADAELWAISQAQVGDPEDDTAVITEIDRATGRVISSREIEAATFVHSGSSAFAFWGGDFFLFTNAGAARTTVSRYRPDDGTLEEVATSDVISPIGVGVSTCVPTDLI